jgi:hypothetical protein
VLSANHEKSFILVWSLMMINTFLEEIDHSGAIRQNEEAVIMAMQKKEFFVAYIYCCELVQGLLELTLQVDDSLPGCSDCLSLLHKRCMACLPRNQHLPERLAHEIVSIVSEKERIVARLRYDGAPNANGSAYELVSVLYKKYLELKEWINLYGQKVHYREGITISKPENRTIDTSKLIDYFEGIHSHSIQSSKSVKDRLTEFGFNVEIMTCGKSIPNNDFQIFEVKGDWGPPGIPALYLLFEMFEILTGEKATSSHIGRGYQFREVLKHLKASCRRKTAPLNI